MKGFIVILLLVQLKSFSQGHIIPGQVIDIKRNPISSASISVVGENASATTDDAGLFSLKLPSGIKKGDPITLSVSKDGYHSAKRHIPVSYLITTITLVKIKNFKQSKATIKEPKIDPVPTTVIQTNPVTSYFQSGGITAGQVNIGAVPRVLDPQSANKLLLALPNKTEKIMIQCIMGDTESFKLATQVKQVLIDNKYTNVDGVNQALFNNPVTGQYIDRDSTGVKITIGSRQ